VADAPTYAEALTALRAVEAERDALQRQVDAVRERVMRGRLETDDGYRNAAIDALIDVSDLLRAALSRTATEGDR
jgi:hypothetical protein